MPRYLQTSFNSEQVKMWLSWVFSVAVCLSVADAARCGKGYCVLNSYCSEDDILSLRERLGIAFKAPDQPECEPYEVCCKSSVGQRGATQDSPDKQDKQDQSFHLSPPTLPGSDFDYTCGQSKPDPNVRANGDLSPFTSKFAEYPWTVRITGKGGTVLAGELVSCGGSLIDPQVVLTAGHCLDLVSAENINVRAGEWELDMDFEPLRHQDRDVRSVVIHKEINNRNGKNDLALLLLSEPFELADNVNTICLPESSTHTTDCVVSGWGLADEFAQTVMKGVKLSIIPHAECQESLRETRLGKYFILDKNFICAADGNWGDKTCVGDGGGPLICRSHANNNYEQVGVVSWSIDCGADGKPGVYVNVAKYKEWIEKTMDEFERDGFKSSKLKNI